MLGGDFHGAAEGAAVGGRRALQRGLDFGDLGGGVEGLQRISAGHEGGSGRVFCGDAGADRQGAAAELDARIGLVLCLIEGGTRRGGCRGRTKCARHC